jgi:hypothetical protein
LPRRQIVDLTFDAAGSGKIAITDVRDPHGVRALSRPGLLAQPDMNEFATITSM